MFSCLVKRSGRPPQQLAFVPSLAPQTSLPSLDAGDESVSSQNADSPKICSEFFIPRTYVRMFFFLFFSGHVFYSYILYSCSVERRRQRLSLPSTRVCVADFFVSPWVHAGRFDFGAPRACAQCVRFCVPRQRV